MIEQSSCFKVNSFNPHMNQWMVLYDITPTYQQNSSMFASLASHTFSVICHYLAYTASLNLAALAFKPCLNFQ